MIRYSIEIGEDSLPWELYEVAVEGSEKLCSSIDTDIFSYIIYSYIRFNGFIYDELRLHYSNQDDEDIDWSTYGPIKLDEIKDQLFESKTPDKCALIAIEYAINIISKSEDQNEEDLRNTFNLFKSLEFWKLELEYFHLTRDSQIQSLILNNVKYYQQLINQYLILARDYVHSVYAHSYLRVIIMNARCETAKYTDTSQKEGSKKSRGSSLKDTNYLLYQEIMQLFLHLEKCVNDYGNRCVMFLKLRFLVSVLCEDNDLIKNCLRYYEHGLETIKNQRINMRNDQYYGYSIEKEISTLYYRYAYFLEKTVLDQEPVDSVNSYLLSNKRNWFYEIFRLYQKSYDYDEENYRSLFKIATTFNPNPENSILLEKLGKLLLNLRSVNGKSGFRLLIYLFKESLLLGDRYIQDSKTFGLGIEKLEYASDIYLRDIHCYLQKIFASSDDLKQNEENKASLVFDKIKTTINTYMLKNALTKAYMYEKGASSYTASQSAQKKIERASQSAQEKIEQEMKTARAKIDQTLKIMY